MIREFQLLLTAFFLLFISPIVNSQILPGDYPEIISETYSGEESGGGTSNLASQAGLTKNN